MKKAAPTAPTTRPAQNSPKLYLFSESSVSLLSQKKGIYDLYMSIYLLYDSLSINGYILLEHSYSQSKLVRQAMLYSGFVNICTYNDYNNLSRISYGEK